MKDYVLLAKDVHPKIKPNENPITLERLYRAYNFIASIVVEYGETYLPIFELLKNEIEKMEKKSNLFHLAKSINSNQKTQ